MKKGVLLIFFLIGISLYSYSQAVEKFKYVVTYKWGLIQKDAGDVLITKTPQGKGYELKMIASTKPWADNIYKVRDTMISVTSKEKYLPQSYTFLKHEKNKYRRDDIKFTYSGNKVSGQLTKYKEGKKGEITKSTHQLEGTVPTNDMLSVYFFLRELDYSKLKSGDEVKATIFSGSKSENLVLKCKGKEKIKLRDKKEYETWHIVFNFTREGGKKSSDDISCWISTDPSHIPLQIIGELPIGQIRVQYAGS